MLVFWKGKYSLTYLILTDSTIAYSTYYFNSALEIQSSTLCAGKY